MAAAALAAALLLPLAAGPPAPRMVRVGTGACRGDAAKGGHTCRHGGDSGAWLDLLSPASFAVRFVNTAFDHVAMKQPAAAAHPITPQRENTGGNVSGGVSFEDCTLIGDEARHFMLLDGGKFGLMNVRCTGTVRTVDYRDCAAATMARATENVVVNASCAAGGSRRPLKNDDFEYSCAAVFVGPFAPPCPYKSDDNTSNIPQQLYLVPDEQSEFELVYDFATEACPDMNLRAHRRGDVPDAEAVAWFNPRNNQSTFIMATGGAATHAFVAAGMSLENLTKDACTRVVLNSSRDGTPNSYANYQWLQSVRLLANGSAYGLVHNEFKAEFTGNRSYCSCQETAGHRDGGNCSGVFGHTCELWSTGLAVSHDGGETFHLWGPPPTHLVANLPTKYVKDQKLQGYGAVSPMLRGSDGAYYSLINLHGPDSGRCPFRAADITTPSGFRGRGPSGAFDHRWRSPYLPGPPGERCAKLTPGVESSGAPHTNVRRIVGMNGQQRYVSLGGSGSGGGIGYSFSQEPAYEKAMIGGFDELRRELVLEGLSRWGGTAKPVQSYPSLLDHASPRLGRSLGDSGSIEDGDNYLLTDGSELYVYFGAAGGNILRHRVRFSTSPPVPVPPPPPPTPADCTTLLVRGAGRDAANGLYHMMPISKLTLFQKGNYQIRRAADAWEVVSTTSGKDQVLYMALTAANATSMPPTSGWRCEMATADQRIVPAPAAVVCHRGVGAAQGSRHPLKNDDFNDEAGFAAGLAATASGSGMSVNAAPAAPDPPTVAIVGPGASARSPVYGSSVVLAISGSASWVRLDRPDGVAEIATGPGDGSGRGWMTVADESVSFEVATTFPVWARPSWGSFRLFFGGAANNRSVDIVASGWNGNGVNATRVTANSSALTIHYSTACRAARSTMRVENIGPGAVRLSTSGPPSATGCAMTQVAYLSYVPSATDHPPGCRLCSRPNQFNSWNNLRVEAGDRNFSYTLRYASSGIFYWGAAPSCHGRMMALTAGGHLGFDGEPATHPTALVVADADGRVDATLPANFAGEVFHVTPLAPSANRSGFCLTLTRLTVFSGVGVNFPLCTNSPEHPATQDSASKTFVSVILPSWLHVFGQTNRSSATFPTLNRTVSLPNGRTLTTFFNVDSRWSAENTHVHLSFTFASQHAGKTARLQLLLHDRLSEADGPPSRFSVADMACVPTPVIPLPQRLVTSVTWATAEMLFDGTSPDGTYSFLETYAQLGLNTVPSVGLDPGGALPLEAPWAFAGNRTGWAGRHLRYGPELSGGSNAGWNGDSGVYSAPPNATLVREMWLAHTGRAAGDAEVADEMRKWQRAQAFFNQTKRIDYAYDGVFWQADVDAFCSTMQITVPEIIFVDDEGFGDYDSWRLHVSNSANAVSQRYPGESDDALAWRIADQMLGSWSACLKDEGKFKDGAPVIIFYGDDRIGPAPRPAPDAIMHANGFTASPSPYGPVHHPRMFADWLRVHKQRMVNNGRSRLFLPWLTAGTYGEMTAEALLEGALLSLGVGATGFAFFSAADFDDGAKILALSTATAMAAPFEEIFFEGEPLTEVDVTATDNVLAWSGMRGNGSVWLVVTPSRRGVRTTLTLANQTVGGAAACDLVSARPMRLAGSSFSAVLRSTVVLHIASDAASAAGCGTPLGEHVWWPSWRWEGASEPAEVAEGSGLQ